MKLPNVSDPFSLHLWGASVAENPPTVAYDAVMPDRAGADAEKGVLSWLEKVVCFTAIWHHMLTSQHEYGFCFVTGVPVSPTATEELIRRMSHIRETHCTFCNSFPG